MKYVLVLALLLGAGLSWLHRSSAPVQQAVAAPARPLAPDGTYYVMSYFATVAQRGIIGWTPGQEVHADRQTAAGVGSVAITDGAHRAVVPQALLTRDVQTGEALRRADQASQDQIQMVNATILKEGRAYELATYKEAARNIERANAVQMASSTIGAFNNRLNMPAYSAYGGSYGGYYNASYSTLPNSSVASGDFSSGASTNANLPAAGEGSAVMAAAPADAMGTIPARASSDLEARARNLAIPPSVINQLSNDVSHRDLAQYLQQ